MRLVKRLTLAQLGSDGKFEKSADETQKRLLEWWKSGKQSRPPFQINRLNHQARPLLEKQFLNKCAYCEIIQQAAPHDVELFRPKSRYWWLACNWNNYYLACQRCNRTKRDRFPIIRGDRAEKPDDDVSLESPALLDPCADNPRQHLRLRRDGTLDGLSSRGEATIEVLDLNRGELISARANDLTLVIGFIEGGLYSDLPNFVADDAAFSSLIRTYLLEHYADNQKAMEIVNKHEPLDSQQVDVTEDIAQDDIEPSEVTSAERIGLDDIRIKWIKITNFKSFEGTVQISFEENPIDDRTVPWMVLLGENGAGKSSLLEAIAIGLTPSSFLSELNVDDYLPIKKNKAGRRKTGSIRLCLDKEGYEILEVKVNTKPSYMFCRSDF